MPCHGPTQLDQQALVQIARAALHMLASGELDVDLPRPGLHMQRLGVVEVHRQTCRRGGCVSSREWLPVMPSNLDVVQAHSQRPAGVAFWLVS